MHTHTSLLYVNIYGPMVTTNLQQIHKKTKRKKSKSNSEKINHQTTREETKRRTTKTTRNNQQNGNRYMEKVRFHSNP